MEKSWKSVVSLALVVCLAGLARAGAQVMNRTIATVNGEAVLLSEFEKNWTAFLEQQKDQLPADKITPEWEKSTKQKMLDQMVNDKMLLQEAKRQNLRVNQRELENGVIQVKSRFLPEPALRELDRLAKKAMADQTAKESGDLDLSTLWRDLGKAYPEALKEADGKFKEELAKEGLSDKKFQDRIKDQLLVVQLTRKEVFARSKPPAEEEVKDLFDKVTVVIDGKEPKGVSKDEMKDLEDLAEYFSAQTQERVRARHILIEVAKDASFKDKSQARRKIEDLLKKAQGGADFADLAQKNSADKPSAERGGDLGFFTRGMMVPSFENVAFSLGVGQVSSVVETPFGFHLIKVEEKRAPAKLKFENAEEALEEYLRQHKSQKAFEEYVEELRKKATIKLDITL